MGGLQTSSAGRVSQIAGLEMRKTMRGSDSAAQCWLEQVMEAYEKVDVVVDGCFDSSATVTFGVRMWKRWGDGGMFRKRI